MFLKHSEINQRSYYNLPNSVFKILNSGIILKTFTHVPEVDYLGLLDHIPLGSLLRL